MISHKKLGEKEKEERKRKMKAFRKYVRQNHFDKISLYRAGKKGIENIFLQKGE